MVLALFVPLSTAMASRTRLTLCCLSTNKAQSRKALAVSAERQMLVSVAGSHDRPHRPDIRIVMYLCPQTIFLSLTMQTSVCPWLRHGLSKFIFV